MFALANAAIQVGRTAFVFVTLRRSLRASHPLSRNLQRVLPWLMTGALWIIGGLLEGEARYASWGLALAVDEPSAATVSACVGSVALWWIYFDHTEELTREVISSKEPELVALRSVPR